MKLRARQMGEWPPGIHWTAGEVRDVPGGYPGADGPLPGWLERQCGAATKKASSSKPKAAAGSGATRSKGKAAGKAG